MEVKNACGRKVSLLNDDERPAYLHHPRLSIHSRKSSCSSHTSREDTNSSQFSSVASPTRSPRTPRLRRLDSNSSQSTLHTPSPMTPHYPFEPLEQTKAVTPRDQYYRADASYYPAMPQPHEVARQPYYTMFIRGSNDLTMEDAFQQEMAQPSMAHHYSYSASEPVTPISPQPDDQNSIPEVPDVATQNPSTSSNNTPKSSKKKYPCPHAQRYSCMDTFTTSGHAARHGKKHTGEKNILCPTCNKAFTRKDNMKQHQRTHKSDCDPPSSSKLPASTVLSPESRDSHNSSRQRLKLSLSRSTASPDASLLSTAEMDMAMDAMKAEYDQAFDDEKSKTSSHLEFRSSGVNDSMNDTNLSIDTALAEGSRPSLNRKFSGTSQDGEGESPGLDALAMAASGMNA
ncbi:hypothetical protein MMC06_002684 [Schaereria dolodes]|nr:hypothetical protein [Schaereria dolodes]